MFSDNVERWRPVVNEELARLNIPLPADLILAVIHVESRGHAGSTNDKSGASGLMQVMPKTLDWYNKQRGEIIPLVWLRDKQHAGEQIRVGIWVLAQFWRGAYQYLRDRIAEIPTDELARIADLFYVAGPGATKKKLDKLSIPFFSFVEQKFPDWNALPHPRNVFAKLPEPMIWNLSELSKWLETSVLRNRRAQMGAVAVLAAAGLAYWFLIKKGKPK
ncbi:MAG: transglycosylase SLT domain-containing protein [Rugosibacter sp.]|nr:transglycosylase SLT domain-containing protein [Rugosibacter sp.]